MMKQIFPSSLSVRSAVLTGVLSISLCGLGSAAVVAEYRFAGNSAASTDLDATTSASSMTYGTFSGTGTIANPAHHQISNNELSTSAGATGTSSTVGNTLAKAITNQAYVSFTLNTTGAPIGLADLSFDQLYRNTNPTISNSHIFVLSSLTGFTDADALNPGGFFLGYGDTNGGNDSAARSIDLTGNAAFAEVDGLVEFRFYFVDAVNSTDRRHILDNVVLTSVPEPSALMLLAIGSCCGLSIRRKVVR